MRLLPNIEIRILHESHIVVKVLLQSNRNHRLTFRRVIIEKWMYTAQVPINNALVLDNLCEYRHIAKLDSLDYISVADCIGLSSTTLA